MPSNFRLILALCTALLAAPALGQGSRDGTINLLPMYGRVPKSEALLQADREFLQYCDDKFPNRKIAAGMFASRGWDFYWAGDLNTAIKRFNQAWLLDSTNARAHWGFGVVMGRRKHAEESVGYFNTAYALDSSNKRLLVDRAISRLDLYEEKKNQAVLAEALQDLHAFLADSMDIKIHSKAYVEAYSSLAKGYAFEKNYPAAWKYVLLTEALAPQALTGTPWFKRLQKEAPRKAYSPRP